MSEPIYEDVEAILEKMREEREKKERERKGTRRKGTRRKGTRRKRARRKGTKRKGEDMERRMRKGNGRENGKQTLLNDISFLIISYTSHSLHQDCPRIFDASKTTLTLYTDPKYHVC